MKTQHQVGTVISSYVFVEASARENAPADHAEAHVRSRWNKLNFRLYNYFLFQSNKQTT